MDKLEMFRQARVSEEPALADVTRTLEELGVRLDPQDQNKVADNVALLGRHWRIVTEDAVPDRNDR